MRLTSKEKLASSDLKAREAKVVTEMRQGRARTRKKFPSI